MRPLEKILVIFIKKQTKKTHKIWMKKGICHMLYLLLVHQWLHNTYQRHIDIIQTPSSDWKWLGLSMSSLLTGSWMLCCSLGYVEREGALPPFSGLTVQRIICCQASYWPCPHKLSSYCSGSLPPKIIVLSQFPTLVPVKLNVGKI